MNLESEYLEAAWKALHPYLDRLPPEVKRAVLIAESVTGIGGFVKVNELRSILGKNWVIAKRTPGVVKRYGPDVNCVSPEQFEAAERQAIENRFK